MVSLLSEVEGQPEAYPSVTPFAREIGAETWEAGPNLALAWQRVEAWVAHRWTPRSIVWTVEGPGEWRPRLTPFALTSIEVWGAGWFPATAAPGPLGLCLDDAIYRVSGVVGADAGAVPEAVQEAVRRLAEYNREIAAGHMAEAAIYSDGETQRPASWAAKGLQLSGAADLLRPWRRVA